MATMKDVAARAGVSVGTVSYVLSGKAERARIPKATCERVYAAAAELNYKEDISAKRLKKRADKIPSYTVVWNTDVNSDILDRFLRGADEYRMSSGEDFELTVLPAGSCEYKERLESLCERCYSGAVFIGLSRENLIFTDQKKLPFPAVIFGEVQSCASVTVSEAGAGRLAAEQFHRCGVKSIAVARKIYKMDDAEARLEAFYKRAGELGLECRELEGEYEYSMEGGITAAHDALTLFPDITGIYYIVDLMALGGENYLLNRMMSGQVKLISHGNSVFSRCTYPGITSTGIPVEKMAGISLEMLAHGSREHITLEAELFERGSCRYEK
ncbi:MAG: LacI family transcriptional regulator [Firmicutes bacterium]|nr:LacI family transcriptional regulator [Bacillota bacterium]